MTSKTIPFKLPSAPLPGAEQWVETRADAVVAPVKRLTLDIPVELHRRLKVYCAGTGLNMADLCRELITKALAEHAA